MKKIIPIIIAILVIIILSYIILFFINKSNINNNVEPVFYFSKQIANDGGSTIYNVLLYKIIKYKNIDNNNAAKAISIGMRNLINTVFLEKK